MTDQQRYDTLGCYGNSYIQTPNFDNIAKNGVIFKQHYIQGAACVPSRPSIFTGRYVSAHRQCKPRQLPKSELLFSEYLRRLGYSTLGFGKFHFGPQKKKGHFEPVGGVDLDPQPKEFPWYGFDYVEVQEDTRAGLYAEYLKKHGFDRKEDLDSGEIGQWKCYTSHYPEEHYQTTWVTNRAIEHIKNHNKDKPLFLFVSYVDPHHPFHVPAPYDKMYNPKELPLPIRDLKELENNPLIKRFYYGREGMAYLMTDYPSFSDYDWQKIKAYYYAKISLIDKNVGRLLGALKDKGFLKDTIVVFTVDHGEYLGDHWLLFKGVSNYDSIIRVPFILSYPEKLPSGLSIDSLTQEVDIFPTLCEILRFPLPEGVQGKSLTPLIEDPQKEIYEEILVETSGLTLRSKDWRLTVRPGEWSELYNLQKDPNQFQNVYYEDKYSKEKEKLMERLIARMQQALPIVKAEALW